MTGEEPDGDRADRAAADDGATDDRPTLADLRGIEGDVYGPAEDSRLLAEAAVDAVEDGLALEVGTGSGWVAATVAEETGATVVGSDLNPHACRAARERGVPAVRADLLGPFREEAFDAVLFNPPYLPTEPDNEWGDWMETALSGGESGRELVDPFLATVGRVLAPGGFALLLVSSLTGFDTVLEDSKRRGFRVTELAQESYPFEVLTVLRLDPARP